MKAPWWAWSAAGAVAGLFLYLLIVSLAPAHHKDIFDIVSPDDPVRKHALPMVGIIVAGAVTGAAMRLTLIRDE